MPSGQNLTEQQRDAILRLADELNAVGGWHVAKIGGWLNARRLARNQDGRIHGGFEADAWWAGGEDECAVEWSEVSWGWPVRVDFMAIRLPPRYCWVATASQTLAPRSCLCVGFRAAELGRAVQVIVGG